MSRNKVQQQLMVKVIDYITTHLTEDLSLSRLAKLSSYSPYYFQRLFKEMIGETPAVFVKRMRLEQAAHLLIYEPHLAITEVGMTCGFSSLSYFTYSFQSYFRTSPKLWRKGAYLERFPREYKNSKNSKLLRRNSKADVEDEAYNEFKWLDLDKVEVTRLPESFTVNRYHIGSYTSGIPDVWKSAYHWCKSRDLLGASTLMIGEPRNNPYITPPEKSFYDCRVTVDPAQVDGESVERFPGGKYVVYSFDIPVPYEDRGMLIECYSELYSYWLPQSGYKYLGNPLEMTEIFEESGGLSLQVRIRAIALPIEPS
ncbi:UNVERIFIED_CONTAM: AraC family transcriptional regulator [Halobacillus marinus]